MRVRIGLLVVLAVAAGSYLALRPEPLPSASDVEVDEDEDDDGPSEPNDWFFRQRAFPVGAIDHAAYVRAQRAVARRASGGPAWAFAGPTNVGGRVTSLAVESFDRYVVGTASGGLFKTTDGGASFVPVGESAFALAIGDVALDPQDPQTVWVGTGEANVGGGSLTYGGSGVYRSADGGATWEPRGLDESNAVGRVVVHPTDGDRVWVAAAGKQYEQDEHRGVYRTTDGGASWSRTLFVDGETGAIDLALNTRSPDTLYAATWTRQRGPDDRRYGGPGSGSGSHSSRRRPVTRRRSGSRCRPRASPPSAWWTCWGGRSGSGRPATCRPASASSSWTWAASRPGATSSASSRLGGAPAPR